MVARREILINILQTVSYTDSVYVKLRFRSVGTNADHTPIERVHLFALKRFLNTSLRTPNLMVYGETGRYPLFVNIYVKCIKFWLRILKLPPCRLPFKAYKMLLHLHERNKRTWASFVCYVLYKYDFGDVWVNQGVGDEKAFFKGNY